ncbi:MAG: preprotein translocase subunit SecG [Ruminococcaceae bacterium]|jgi:preprotein translocase subunit SecG|nr:preprotein translocase subunit SecG [Oscillospiraceae bacterium]
MNWSIVNTVVGVIQIIVSIVLIASVLMQSAKKEGLSGVVGGASETFFGKNKGRTLDATFAVITTICAIVFLVSSLFLSYGMIAVENAENKKASEQQTQEIDADAANAVDGETEEDAAESNAENGEEAAGEEAEGAEETEETAATAE